MAKVITEITDDQRAQLERAHSIRRRYKGEEIALKDLAAEVGFTPEHTGRLLSGEFLSGNLADSLDRIEAGIDRLLALRTVDLAA